MRLLVLLTLAGTAALADDWAPDPGPAFAAAAQESTPVAAPSAPGVCDCVQSKRCWPYVKGNYGVSFADAERELDGSPQGRFMPDALPWTLKTVGKDGHFLRVECGRERKPCQGYRSVLEQRLLVVAFLRTIPVKGSPEDYYDAKTWQIKPPGIALLSEARQCRPTFWKEITAVVGARGDL
jgi:hypothetical protein